jgi:hypothetical protein
MHARTAQSLYRTVLGFQGLYYLFTGIWPLVSIGTFQRVTGPKNDLWLVKTVGVLVCAVAVVLLTAVLRNSRSVEVALLSIGSALALTTIDGVYVMLRVISPVYLADAVMELIIVASLGVLLARLRARSAMPFIP